jgi:hypothetical protein
MVISSYGLRGCFGDQLINGLLDQDTDCVLLAAGVGTLVFGYCSQRNAKKGVQPAHLSILKAGGKMTHGHSQSFWLFLGVWGSGSRIATAATP